MITFDNFSKRLAMAQLKNTSAVDAENLGIILPKYVDTILSLTNQGLVDLSSRFPLYKSQVDLTFIAGQNLYPLLESEVGTTLTDSSEEPFLDDKFIKILDVFDSDGKRHSLNTNGHLMTPAHNTIRFTADKMTELGEKVRIRYQQKPVEIVETDSINLPPNLETGLQLFVASLYISHMGGKDHSIKGDSYFAAYLRHIGEDEAKDLSSTSEVETNTKFEDRGFV